MAEKPERDTITRTEFYGTMSTVMLLIGLVFMNTSRSEDEWYRSITSLVVGSLLIVSGLFYMVASQKSKKEAATPPAPPS